MSDETFEGVIVRHLDAAFNYARWLTGNDTDAEDVVQDAAVRALRFRATFRGESARGWLLTIVRNAWYARLEQRLSRPNEEYEEMADVRADDRTSPEALLVRQQTTERVRRAVEELPADFREVIVLRELEGLSYKEIATA